MTVKEAVAREKRNMGSDVHLLDYQRLKGRVLVILYYMDSQPLEPAGILRSYRLATFHGEFLMSSFIVKSVWRDL